MLEAIVTLMYCWVNFVILLLGAELFCFRHAQGLVFCQTACIESTLSSGMWERLPLFLMLGRENAVCLSSLSQVSYFGLSVLTQVSSTENFSLNN